MHIVLFLILQEILTILDNERHSPIHHNADAFVLVLLTHGSKGSIFGIDGKKVSIDDITKLFDGNHCPQLQTRPKLFFIQACQGRKSPHYAVVHRLLA